MGRGQGGGLGVDHLAGPGALPLPACFVWAGAHLGGALCVLSLALNVAIPTAKPGAAFDARAATPPSPFNPALAVVLARFLPILRTFTPFVAGMGRMPYGQFLRYSVLGAALWTAVCCGAGRLFGKVPLVRSHFSLVILGVILISAAPLLVELAMSARRSRVRKLQLVGPGVLLGAGPGLPGHPLRKAASLKQPGV